MNHMNQVHEAHDKVHKTSKEQEKLHKVNNHTVDPMQKTHIEADVAVLSSTPCWLTATKSIHTAVEVEADERKSVTVS